MYNLTCMINVDNIGSLFIGYHYILVLHRSFFLHLIEYMSARLVIRNQYFTGFEQSHITLFVNLGNLSFTCVPLDARNHQEHWYHELELERHYANNQLQLDLIEPRYLCTFIYSKYYWSYNLPTKSSLPVYSTSPPSTVAPVASRFMSKISRPCFRVELW